MQSAMKILRRNLRSGLVKLKTETPEDMWHLDKVLEPGDIVAAKTTRRKTIKRGNELIKGERVPITIGIELEKAAMESGRIRLRGKIVSGPKDIEQASYHSLAIEPHMEVDVRKARWSREQLERLRRAGTKEPLLFICVLDREEADFASLRESGLDTRGTVRVGNSADRPDDRTGYYSEIARVLEKESGKHNAIIIAGPGFEKENLLNYIKEGFPDLVKGISLEAASHTGRAGIHEIIRKSVNKVLKQTRIARETELVERLLELMGRDGLVTYGTDEVRKAAMSGAVETLLISEDMVPENEGLMDAVEKMRGSVCIITGNHEAGERFLYLGGVAAFLRYRIG